MEGISLKILVGISTAIWFFVCLLLYTFVKQVAWLAGSAVVCCLFFMGATVAASFLVSGAFYLVPLWLGIAILCVVHLYKARQAALWRRLPFEDSGSGHPGSSSHQPTSTGVYI